MALPGSGELRFSELLNEQNESSGSAISANQNISLDALSDSFGASAANVSVDRSLLTGDEDKISHFHSAAFPGQFSNIFLFRGTGRTGGDIINDSTNSDTFVDDNGLGIKAESSVASVAKFTIVDSNGNTLSGTNSNIEGTDNESSNQFDKNLSSVSIDNTHEGSLLKVKVEDDDNAFDSNFSETFTFRKKLAGGALTFSPSQPLFVDDSDESVSAISLNGTVTAGTIQNVDATGTTSVTAGDGGTMTATEDVEDTFTIANTPGVVQITATLQGHPSAQATRNRITGLTGNVDVRYNRQIVSISRSPQNVNHGSSVTIGATSKGATATMRIGYGSNNANATFDAQSDKSVDSLYVAEAETQAFTLSHSSPTTSTSREIVYPKAQYVTGVSAFGVGSAIYILPTLTYSTSGDKTVNVNGSAQTFTATLAAGYNAGMTISSNFNGTTQSGFGNALSITPGTANGVYTISFAGTADDSQTNNQTDSLTVRPTVSLVEDNSKTTADVFGSYSAGLTPTGHSATSLAFTATAVGDTIQYNWSPPGDFTTSAGGGTGQAFLQGSFTSGANTQNYDFDVNVSGGGATSTDATVTIATTVLSQQALTGLTTDSQTVRRGASGDLGVNFTSTNIAKADIVLCFADTTSGNELDDLDSHNLSHVNGQALVNTKNTAVAQAFDYNVPDVGVTKTGLYDVFVRDEDSSGEHLPEARTGTTYDIVIIDKAATDPGNFSTTAGGYSGDQAIAWSASTYAANYKVYRATSEGGSYSLFSSPTSATTTITADSNNTLDFWYKVLAQNDNSYVDDNGGPSTADENSGFNGARNYIVFPVGSNSKNVIANGNQLIRTSLNNSTSTSFTFNDPTNETDAASIVSYAYSLTSDPGNATLNNSTSQNAQIVAGSGASDSGTGTVQLVTTLEGGNDTDTTCTSTMNFFVKHYPKVTGGSSFPNPTKKNVTIISPTSINYQGYRNNGTAMTLTFRIVRYGTQTVINDEGEVTVSDSAITDADITPVSINDLVVNLGIITGTLGVGNQATLQVKFNNNNTAQDPDPGFEDLDTVVVRVPETLTLYVARGGTYTTTFTGAHNSAEDAYNDSSVPANNDVIIFPATAGAPAQGEDLFVLQADGGTSPANGNNKYMKIYQIGGANGSVNSDVIRIATDGQISEYYDFANVPPLAATSISTSQSNTNVSITSATTPTTLAFGNANGQTISFGGKTTTSTVTVNWTDNSTINTSYDVIFNSTTASGLSATATSKGFTGITNGSYSAPTVNAIRGTSTTSANGSAVTVGNTGTIYVQAQVYVSQFIGTWEWTTTGGYSQNITSVTGTTYTRGGLDVDAPRDSSRLGTGFTANTSSTPNNTSQYQIRFIYSKDNYISNGGTQIFQSGGFDVEVNTKLQFSNSAGSLNVSIANGADFFYFGGSVVDSGATAEWTSGDTISSYLHVNSADSYKTRDISLASTVSLGGANDVTETYYYKILNQSSGTTSGTTGYSNQTFPNSVSDAGEFTASNHKMFFVIGSAASVTAELATSDTYTITATSHGYNSDTMTLSLSVDAPSGGGTGGGGSCFPYGTQIWMADDTWKNIENININDKVKSYDVSTDTQPSTDSYAEFLGYRWDGMNGTMAESNVVLKDADYYYDHYQITLENDDVITATYEHPLFVKRTLPHETKYRWVRILHINKDTDKIMTVGGEAIGITDITYHQEEEIFVRLNVEDIDNYFIKTGEKVYIAHNAGKGGD